MSKIKGLILVALAVTALFASCKKDDDAESPKITIVTVDVNAFSIVKGDTVDFKFKALAGDAKIETAPTVMYAFGKNAATPSTPGQVTALTNGYEVTMNQVLDSVGVYTFTITVGDKDGLADTAVVEVTVRNPDVLFTKEINNGVVWNAAGTGKGAWDLDSDSAVSSKDTSIWISIQNLDAAGTAFTGKFSSKNGTSFVKITADYATITKTEAEAAFTAGSVIKEPTPTINDVYVAKKLTKKDTLIYLMKITSIDASAENGDNDGKITFTYKK